MNYWIYIVKNRKIENERFPVRAIFEQRMDDKFWGLGDWTPGVNFVEDLRNIRIAIIYS